MKTAEVRDLMVKRVQEAHKKWPSFADMPELKEPAKIRVKIDGDPNKSENYVAALYDLCGRGAVPSGRYKVDESLETPECVIGGNPADLETELADRKAVRK